ncbi:MAG TPA: efflux RND transporter periplasmic adaptor subunit [Stellaceae bacterium]|nr:efflux RND transporter periplasmic adaptor subunit [Stellaceae bacterium]
MVGRAIGAAVILAAAALAVIWRAGPGDHVPQAVAQMPPPGVPVTAGTVVARNVPVFLNGIGTVQAYNMVAVQSRVDGQIVRIAFQEGQEVKAGDPLVQIDPRPYEAVLDQARAAEQKDEAQLASAQADLQRYASLVGPGFQTRQSYDQQKATVAALKAAITGDRAQIESAQLNLAYSDIRAPIGGRLGARLVDIGNIVHAGSNTTLVTITQLKPIFVSFTLPQQDLDEVRLQQQKAPLAVTALSGDNKTELAQGRLTLIDNTINQATGTIHLKADFANRDERLWPGEFVNVRVILKLRRNVPTVPEQTVEEGADGRFVYVIKPNDTVERRAVTVAAVEDGLAVVTKGLKSGERVVVNGQFRLSDGARVKIVPAAKNVTG